MVQRTLASAEIDCGMNFLRDFLRDSISESALIVKLLAIFLIPLHDVVSLKFSQDR